MRCSFALAVTVLLIGRCGAVHAEDPIKQKLDSARAGWQKQVGDLRKGILQALDESEDSARRNGDKKTVDRSKAERNAFEANGELPTLVNTTYFTANMKQARHAFASALKAAVQQYTKAQNDDAASNIQKELDDFLAEADETSGLLKKGTTWKGLFQLDAGERQPAELEVTRVKGSTFEATIRVKNDSWVMKISGTMIQNHLRWKLDEISKGPQSVEFTKPYEGIVRKDKLEAVTRWVGGMGRNRAAAFSLTRMQK